MPAQLVSLAILLAITWPSAGRAQMKFQLHEIGRPGGSKHGQTSLIDGDLDICSKPWNDDRHVFLENLQISQ